MFGLVIVFHLKSELGFGGDLLGVFGIDLLHVDSNVMKAQNSVYFM